MPYLATAQLWLTQSTLLLQARPSTTRITTKYTITPPKPKSSKRTSTPSETTTEPSTTTTTTPSILPPATLTLKTFDPVSGVTLKYTTNKAAEVSRLIQILGRLARPMAGLPELKDDVVMASTGLGGEVAEGSGMGTPAVEGVPVVKAGGASGQGGQQGGNKKGKKKGKK